MEGYTDETVLCNVILDGSVIFSPRPNPMAHWTPEIRP